MARQGVADAGRPRPGQGRLEARPSMAARRSGRGATTSRAGALLWPASNLKRSGKQRQQPARPTLTAAATSSCGGRQNQQQQQHSLFPLLCTTSVCRSGQRLLLNVICLPLRCLYCIIGSGWRCVCYVPRRHSAVADRCPSTFHHFSFPSQRLPAIVGSG